jgi:hypothetical protein
MGSSRAVAAISASPQWKWDVLAVIDCQSKTPQRQEQVYPFCGKVIRLFGKKEVRASYPFFLIL